ncbi:MAG: glucosaminidase domain-containing protein [Thermodesulfobacteriota bacterium]|nr:glucosaminidase domain-containing protein [Thermodesulfobacteriota bacterium]
MMNDDCRNKELCDSLTGYVSQVDRKFKRAGVAVAFVLIVLSALNIFYSSSTGVVEDILSVPEQASVITEASIEVLIKEAPEPAPLIRDRFFPNDFPRVDRFDVGSSAELIGRLKEFNLWDIPVGSEIPAVIVPGFPAFGQVDIATKKKIFLNTLLPVALTALTYVKQERDALQRIIEKIGVHSIGLDFAGSSDFWRDALTFEEADLVRFLMEKYRTSMADELMTRVNIVPVSLIMAQGAIESSWGTSRFASTGNNLFGIWTWGEEGIVPAGRDNGKKHKIAIYDSILDSVQAYILNLNRLSAYDEFRRMRRETMDSALLAKGLNKYSVQREKYVRSIRAIIHQNHLRDYDKCLLVGADKVNVAAPPTGITRLGDDNKVLLLDNPSQKRL